MPDDARGAICLAMACKEWNVEPMRSQSLELRSGAYHMRRSKPLENRHGRGTPSGACGERFWLYMRPTKHDGDDFSSFSRPQDAG